MFPGKQTILIMPDVCRVIEVALAALEKKTHDVDVLEFVSLCLRSDKDDRPTPRQLQDLRFVKSSSSLWTS